MLLGILAVYSTASTHIEWASACFHRHACRNPCSVWHSICTHFPLSAITGVLLGLLWSCWNSIYTFPSVRIYRRAFWAALQIIKQRPASTLIGTASTCFYGHVCIESLLPVPIKVCVNAPYLETDPDCSYRRAYRNACRRRHSSHTKKKETTQALKNAPHVNQGKGSNAVPGNVELFHQRTEKGKSTRIRRVASLSRNQLLIRASKVTGKGMSGMTSTHMHSSVQPGHV